MNKCFQNYSKYTEKFILKSIKCVIHCFVGKCLPLVGLIYIHFKMFLSFFKRTCISASLIGFIPLRLLMTLPRKSRDMSAYDTNSISFSFFCNLTITMFVSRYPFYSLKMSTQANTKCPESCLPRDMAKLSTFIVSGSRTSASYGASGASTANGTSKAKWHKHGLRRSQD